ncbi:MAG: DUF1499 domain-containing protein [Persicimonas sp.]
MKSRLLIAVAILVGLTVTALLVAASIWPVINEVETGSTPEYPEVQPHYYTADPQRVFEEARASVESLEQWTLVSEDSAAHTLQAERETSVFGFVDDVSVTIDPITEFVTRVHVKSASRVGKGDFGQNARNIEELLAELDRRLGAVKFDPDKLRKDDSDDGEDGADEPDSDEAGSDDSDDDSPDEDPTPSQD